MEPVAFDRVARPKAQFVGRRSSCKSERASFGASSASRTPTYRDRRVLPIGGRCARTAALTGATASGKGGVRGGRKRDAFRTCFALTSPRNPGFRTGRPRGALRGTWLRSLGLGDSTVLAARLNAGDLRLGVAGRLVGIYDAIGASAAQQRGVVVRDLERLVIHADVICRHIEDPGLWREGSRLLVFRTKRRGTDLPGIVILTPGLRAVLLDHLRLAGLHVDVSGPIDLWVVFFGDQQRPGLAIERVGEAVAVEMDEGLGLLALHIEVGQDHLVDPVVIPFVVRRHLKHPLGDPGIGVAGKNGHRPFVVARPLHRVPGAGIARAVIDQIQLRESEDVIGEWGMYVHNVPDNERAALVAAQYTLPSRGFGRMHLPYRDPRNSSHQFPASTLLQIEPARGDIGVPRQHHLAFGTTVAPAWAVLTLKASA